MVIVGAGVYPDEGGLVLVGLSFPIATCLLPSLLLSLVLWLA